MGQQRAPGKSKCQQCHQGENNNKIASKWKNNTLRYATLQCTNNMHVTKTNINEVTEQKKQKNKKIRAKWQAQMDKDLGALLCTYKTIIPLTCLKAFKLKLTPCYGETDFKYLRSFFYCL